MAKKKTTLGSTAGTTVNEPIIDNVLTNDDLSIDVSKVEELSPYPAYLKENLEPIENLAKAAYDRIPAAPLEDTSVTPEAYKKYNDALDKLSQRNHSSDENSKKKFLISSIMLDLKGYERPVNPWDSSNAFEPGTELPDYEPEPISEDVAPENVSVSCASDSKDKIGYRPESKSTFCFNGV